VKFIVEVNERSSVMHVRRCDDIERKKEGRIISINICDSSGGTRSARELILTGDVTNVPSKKYTGKFFEKKNVIRWLLICVYRKSHFAKHPPANSDRGTASVLISCL